MAEHPVERAKAADFLSLAKLDAMAWGEQDFIVDGEHTWRIWCEFARVYVIRRQDAALADTQGIAGALLLFLCNDGQDMLHKIMVHPSCRGQGMGTKLMAAALAQAASPVMLTVDPANHRAVELYKRTGFEILKHVPGFYRHDEPRYVMRWRPGTRPAPAAS